MQTYQIKKEKVVRGRQVFDVKDKILGRVATDIARALLGKDKVNYTPHVDMGDFVTVVNASQIRLTGRKEDQKVYYRHSGYLGNLRIVSFKKMQTENPAKVIVHAVSGMLPDNRLKKNRLARLEVFTGSKKEETINEKSEKN